VAKPSTPSSTWDPAMAARRGSNLGKTHLPTRSSRDPGQGRAGPVLQVGNLFQKPPSSPWTRGQEQAAPGVPPRTSNPRLTLDQGRGFTAAGFTLENLSKTPPSFTWDQGQAKRGMETTNPGPSKWEPSRPGGVVPPGKTTQNPVFQTWDQAGRHPPEVFRLFRRGSTEPSNPDFTWTQGGQGARCFTWTTHFPNPVLHVGPGRRRACPTWKTRQTPLFQRGDQAG